MNYKYLEEKAKLLGKQLLIENVRVSINPKNIEVFDKPKLVESSNGSQYTARAIIRNVPSSKFTENLNNRIYGRDLDEKIIREGTAEGTLSLVDHPSDEGSIGNICGVWHNPHMDENYSYADWYLTGSKGQDILEHIMAGAKDIGISRVGYGSFKEDNKTVDPNDYILERWGDCVLNPSQEVFATLEQTIELPESFKESNSLFIESVTNKCNNKIEENKSEEQYTMLKESVNIKNNIRVILKEAKSNKKSIKEAIEDIKFWQAEVPLEEKDLHTYINGSLTELSEKMEVEVSNATKSLKEKEGSLEELKAKYKIAEQTIADLTERYKKAQAIIEKGEVGDVKILTENASKMKADISKLMKERILMATDLKCYTEDVSGMQSDIKVLMKERKDMTSDIKVYEKKLTEAEKHIKNCERILEDDYGFAFDDDNSMIDDGTEVIKAEDLVGNEVIVDGDVFVPAEDDMMDMDIDTIDNGGDDFMGGMDDDTLSYSEHYNRKFKETDDEDEDDKKDDKDKKDDDKEIKESDDSDEDDKKDKEDDDKEIEEAADMKDKMAAIRAGKSPDDAKDGDAEDEKADKKDDKKDEAIRRLKTNKVQESVKAIPAVAQLFAEAFKENRSLGDVKKQILESKTVLEAARKIQKFSEVKGNDSMSYSTAKKDTTIAYKFNR